MTRIVKFKHDFFYRIIGTQHSLSSIPSETNSRRHGNVKKPCILIT